MQYALYEHGHSLSKYVVVMYVQHGYAGHSVGPFPQVGWRGMAGDFIMLLRMECDLNLINCLFLEFPFNIFE